VQRRPVERRTFGCAIALASAGDAGPHFDPRYSTQAAPANTEASTRTAAALALRVQNAFVQMRAAAERSAELMPLGVAGR
jgi:hypothetical protein